MYLAHNNKFSILYISGPDKRRRGWHHADICHVMTNVVTMTIGPGVRPTRTSWYSDSPLLSAVRQLHKLLSIEYYYNTQQDGCIILHL